MNIGDWNFLGITLMAIFGLWAFEYGCVHKFSKISKRMNRDKDKKNLNNPASDNGGAP